KISHKEGSCRGTIGKVKRCSDDGSSSEEKMKTNQCPFWDYHSLET
ncbi:hypothetical protein CEXT_225021, partial [Caerostris extrusa]